MNRPVTAVFIAIVTFVIVWFVLDRFGSREIPVTLEEERRSPFQPSGREPMDLRERDPVRHRGVEVETRPIDDDRPAAVGQGKLVVLATLPDRTTPPELRISTDPPLPDPARRPGGLELEAVPAGIYQVTVHGGDVVPVYHRDLEIEAGRATVLRCKIRKGVRPRGVVLDADDGKPIAGAWIDFNGAIRAKSGADGRFAVERLLERTALDIITVSNDVYGSIPFKGLNVEDVGNMKLFLGGGRGVVRGEIVNGTSIPFPNDAMIRVTLPPTFELRRTLELKGREIFKLEKMYEGTFRFELHFPGGEFPVHRQLVRVPPWRPDADPIVDVRFVLEPGATLTGRFLGDSRFVNGMVFQLRDRRNHVVAEAEVNAEGRYRFENVAPMNYVPVVVSGRARFQLPQIDIEGDGVITRDVDVLRRRWAQ